MKVLFLIHDLGNGGAEKVLVNLLNNMNHNTFDITLISLFGGINEQFLSGKVRYKKVFRKPFRGNKYVMKMLKPEMLHRLIVKEQYDIEISFLEGPSARIISGCTDLNTKLITWTHVEQHTLEKLSRSFRSREEALMCYARFDQAVCVSEYVKNDFLNIIQMAIPCKVLYNTVESEHIRELSALNADELKSDSDFRLAAVGTLKESKGYMRLLSIIKRLVPQYNVHLYILGTGPLEQEMKSYIHANHLDEHVSLLGYHTNPYKYVSKCDLFVCASFAEGFSTAVTEALIVGTPVCTVDVSGMRELLGDSEYGVVTENSEDALYDGIRKLLDDRNMLDYYKQQAKIRGEAFDTKKTVTAVEKLLTDVYEGKHHDGID
jgi:glycosyltransferase involved in cell wall biosynthesis